MDNIEKEAREIALKHCGNVADYLGPDLESQMGIYLAEDIAKALQKKQDRIEVLEKKLANYDAITKPTMFFSEGEVVSDSPVFLNKEFVCRYCERVTYYAWRPSSYEDFEMGVKSCEYRIAELESALKDAMDYIPDKKLFERANKAIGGGK